MPEAFMNKETQNGDVRVIEELYGLWQQCAKSSYAESPETEEQRDFVRHWNR